jgi:hypothetical protein
MKHPMKYLMEYNDRLSQHKKGLSAYSPINPFLVSLTGETMNLTAITFLAFSQGRDQEAGGVTEEK